MPNDPCPDCFGTGWHKGIPAAVCEVCKGTGEQGTVLSEGGEASAEQSNLTQASRASLTEDSDAWGSTVSVPTRKAQTLLRLAWEGYWLAVALHENDPDDLPALRWLEGKLG